MSPAKQEPASVNSKRAVPGASIWTSEADEQLRSLVKQHGPKRWAVISRELKVKTSKQCRRRWKNVLNATRKTGDWTGEEDSKLLEGHRVHGNKWETLAKLVGGRTDNATKNRFAVLSKRGLDKQPQTPTRRRSSASRKPTPAAQLRQHQGAASSPQQLEKQPKPSAAAIAAATALMSVSPSGAMASPPVAMVAQHAEAGRSPPDDGARPRPPTRQRRKPNRNLSITIPNPLEAGIGSGSDTSSQGPVLIRVHRDLLSPKEVALAADINVLGNGQLHIALEDDPPSSTSSDGLQWASAVNQQSPAFVQMKNFCLHTGLTPKPTSGLRSSSRLQSAAMPSSTCELNDGHRALLHKLLWRGKVSCSPPEHRYGTFSGSRQAAAKPYSRQRPAEAGSASVAEARPAAGAAPVAAWGATNTPQGSDMLLSPTSVVLSPTFELDEIDMLLDALSQPQG